MGILVTEGTLPSGIQVSNVYMSFAEETVSVQSVPTANTFLVSVCYRVFADPSKSSGTNIRVPMSIVISEQDIDASVYEKLYDKLKTNYPNSSDWHENSFPGNVQNFPL